MPAFRSKMRCIGYATEPVPKKPRVKKVLTEDEKEEAALKRGINKLLKEKRLEWAATLKPWKGDMRLPLGTLVGFFGGNFSCVVEHLCFFSLSRRCIRVMVCDHVFKTDHILIQLLFLSKESILPD
jgi:hypothetical protein